MEKPFGLGCGQKLYQLSKKPLQREMDFRGGKKTLGISGKKQIKLGKSNPFWFMVFKKGNIPLGGKKNGVFRGGWFLEKKHGKRVFFKKMGGKKFPPKLKGKKTPKKIPRPPGGPHFFFEAPKRERGFFLWVGWLGCAKKKSGRP
jgi:hypothetical protein